MKLPHWGCEYRPLRSMQPSARPELPLKDLLREFEGYDEGCSTVMGGGNGALRRRLPRNASIALSAARRCVPSAAGPAAGDRGRV
jgi:hypothetical protein